MMLARNATSATIAEHDECRGDQCAHRDDVDALATRRLLRLGGDAVGSRPDSRLSRLRRRTFVWCSPDDASANRVSLPASEAADEHTGFAYPVGRERSRDSSIGGVLEVTVVGLGCNNFGRRVDADGNRDASCTQRSTRASPSSTRPTSTATARARRCSARRSRDVARSAVIATKFGHVRRSDRGAAGHRAHGSGSPSKTASDGSAPTGSTSTSCTHRTRRRRSRKRWRRSPNWSTRARSAAPVRRTLPGGRSPTPTGSRAAAGSRRFVTAQNAYSLLDRSVEAEVIPACAHFDVGHDPVQPACQRPAHRQAPSRPAAGAGHAACDRCPAPTRDGWLTDRNFDIVEALEAFAPSAASPCSTSPSAVLPRNRRWSRSSPGAMSPEQVQANARGRRWRPSAADLEELDRIAPRR